MSVRNCATALDFDTEFASTAKADNFLDLRAPRQNHHPRWRGYFHCLKYCSDQVSFVIELAASTTLTPTTICAPMSSGILFRRIVERVTKVLTTDSMFDDNSSRRRGGSCGEGQKKQSQQQEKKKSKANSRPEKKKLNIVGASVPAPLHEERVIARARRRVFIPSSTSETPPMNAVTLKTSVDVVSKSFHLVVKATQIPKYAVQPMIGLVYADRYGGRRPRCVVAGFLARGLAARSIRAEVLGDGDAMGTVRGGFHQPEAYSTFSLGMSRYR